MLRRLSFEQPESFAFTSANLEWARGQIAKYPEGRQASAVIPLLWRAQEQEGWVTRPAIEEIARMLDMASIRVLEVATFYFMFQLQPVGSVAHVQVCGTTSCMICGAEDLLAVCREKIAANAHELSGDGKLSWEEVECLGACANAPMAQIGKDYYEDLTAERFGEILDALARGEVPTPGPQNGRFASEPKAGLTSLKGGGDTNAANASVALAGILGDTVKRIDGTEPVPTSTEPGEDRPAPDRATARATAKPPAPDADADETTGQAAPPTVQHAATLGVQPAALKAPRDGDAADDLKRIKGVGPKLEALLNDLGFFHFDQIAAWTEEEIAWVDDNIADFKGRASRDDWVGQARLLASGGETEFSRRVDEGDVY